MLSPYMSPVERVWFYSLRILCGLILLFLILPVLVIIPLSFNSGSFLVYPLQGFSLHWYQDFFASAEWMRALRNSIIVAPAATVLAMVFGTLAAIGLTRGNFPGKALVMALVISPMVVPVVIIGAGSCEPRCFAADGIPSGDLAVDCARCDLRGVVRLRHLVR